MSNTETSNLPSKFYMIPTSFLNIRLLSFLYEHSNRYTFIDEDTESSEKIIYLPTSTISSNIQLRNQLSKAIKSSLEVFTIDISDNSFSKKISDFDTFLHSFENDILKYNSSKKYLKIFEQISNKIPLSDNIDINQTRFSDVLETKMNIFNDNYPSFFETEGEAAGYIEGQSILKEKIKQYQKLESNINDKLSKYSDIIEGFLNNSFENFSDSEISHFINFINTTISYFNLIFKDQNRKEIPNEFQKIISVIYFLSIHKRFQKRIKFPFNKYVLSSLKQEEKDNMLNIIKENKNKEFFHVFSIFKEKSKNETFRKSMFNKQEIALLKEYSIEILKKFNKYDRTEVFHAFKVLYYFDKSSLKMYQNSILKSYPNIIQDILNKQIPSDDFVIKEKLLETRRKLQNISKTYQDKWICSVDIEFVNRNGKTHIFEIGYTLRKGGQTKKLHVKNFIITDTKIKKNSYISPTLCNSKHTTLEEAIKELNKDFARVKKVGGIIIGNGIDFDINKLVEVGAQFHTEDIIDVSDILTFLDKNNRLTTLKSICDLLGIETQNLHNASNDAYYSTRAFIKLLHVYLENNQSDLIKKSLSLKIQTEKKNNNSFKPIHFEETELTDRKYKLIIHNIEEYNSIQHYKAEDFHSYEAVDLENFINSLSKKLSIEDEKNTFKHLKGKIGFDFKDLQVRLFKKRKFITLEDAIFIFKIFCSKFESLNLEDLPFVIDKTYSLKKIDMNFVNTSLVNIKKAFSTEKQNSISDKHRKTPSV